MLHVFDREKFLTGSHVYLVCFFDLAPFINIFGWIRAMSVKVQKLVKVILVEFIDLSCVLLWNMAVADMFAKNGAVFPFNQSIVVSFPRS